MPTNTATKVRNEGWVLLKNLIPKKEIKTIRAEIEKAVLLDKNSENNKTSLVGVHYSPSILNNATLFTKYLNDNKIRKLMENCLGKPFRISMCVGIIIDPDSERSPWHVDWPFNSQSAMHIKSPFPDALMQLTSIWMLDDFTLDNGTIILPNSHKKKFEPALKDFKAQIKGEKIITGKAGSVLIIDSRLWHAPAPNKTDKNRVAISVRYVPWWLNLYPLYDSVDRTIWVTNKKLKENYSPKISKKKFSKISKSAKELLFHTINS